MYTTFRIQNFRGFKDLELKDIARVNLIAGKNNVGKTSLLEAVLIHAGRYKTVLSRIGSNPEKTYSAGEEIDAEFSGWASLFYNFETSLQINLSGDGAKHIAYEALPDRFRPSLEARGMETVKIFLTETNLSQVPFNNIESGNSPSVRISLELSRQSIETLNFEREEELTFLLGVFAGRLIEGNSPQMAISNYVPASFPVSSEINKKRLDDLKRNKNTQFIVKILQILEPMLSSVDTLDGGIYADIGKPQLLSINSMGGGIQQLTSIILAIAASKDGVLLIDEIENGLHYSVQTDVWKAIDEASKLFNVQIFATTHSLEMIEAAQAAFKASDENSFRFYRLDRNRETQEIVAVRYSDNTIDAAMRLESEVRG